MDEVVERGMGLLGGMGYGYRGLVAGGLSGARGVELGSLREWL